MPKEAYVYILASKKTKNRGRQWKINLIEKMDPSWRDLSNDFLDSATTRRMTGGEYPVNSNYINVRHNGASRMPRPTNFTNFTYSRLVLYF